MLSTRASARADPGAWLETHPRLDTHPLNPDDPIVADPVNQQPPSDTPARAHAWTTPDPAAPLLLDVLVIGGGAAGLWLLDELVRRGDRALLLERYRLGSGQTVCAQGILHGGLKYMLDGMLHRAADAIRDMPALWRACLRGEREPRLLHTRVRAEHCHLWRTATLRSMVGMIGARAGLRVAPVVVARDQRPAALRDCPGEVFRLDEQVIDPVSLVADFAQRLSGRLLRIGDRVEITPADAASAGAEALDVRLRDPDGGSGELWLRTRHVVLAAGAGAADWLDRLGIRVVQMQRRPLHMAMVRGALPPLNGHCVDGARTRVTITHDTDSTGAAVWQLGGQLAEDGVALSPPELIARAQRELSSVLPGLDLQRTQWAAYRVDRAEALSEDHQRPNDATVLGAGRVLTAWPTKLALAPRLAQRVLAQLGPPTLDAPRTPWHGVRDWPYPQVAAAPWEDAAWSSVSSADAV